MSSKYRLIIGVSGASGVRYALKFLEVVCSLASKGVFDRVYLVYTNMADTVSRFEIGVGIRDLVRQFKCVSGVYSDGDWACPLASSSNTVGYDMVVIPCSMDLVSRIAYGMQSRLIERILYNVLRVGRRIVLVIRETPLTTIDLENLLKLSRQGVVILPASPGFYTKPKTIDDLLLFICSKVLDTLGIEHGLPTKWSP